MNFKEEVLSHYIDDQMLVSKDRDPTHWSTGNGLLFTGIFYVLLALQGKVDLIDRVHFQKAVKACEFESGCFHRDPNRPDKEGQDDYIGIAAASYFLGLEFAREIADFGRVHGWNFAGASRFCRFPGLPAFFKIAAQIPVNFLEKTLLEGAIFYNALQSKSQVSDKILVWLQVEVLKSQGLCKKATNFWEKRMLRDFGSTAKLFEPSFGVSHPFAQINF